MFHYQKWKWKWKWKYDLWTGDLNSNSSKQTVWCMHCHVGNSLRFFQLLSALIPYLPKALNFQGKLFHFLKKCHTLIDKRASLTFLISMMFLNTSLAPDSTKTLILQPCIHLLFVPLNSIPPTTPAAIATPPKIATPIIPSLATLSSIKPRRLPACKLAGS